MKKFVDPEVCVELLNVQDVIAASGSTSGDTFDDSNTGDPI